MTITITEPSADQQLLNLYNSEQRMRVASGALSLEVDATYALCLIRLAPAVEQSDYPALKTAIEAVTGVQEIRVVTDYHTRATVPDGRVLAATVVFAIRMPLAEE